MMIDILNEIDNYLEKADMEAKADYPNSICLDYNNVLGGGLPSATALMILISALGFNPSVNFNKENRGAIDFLNDGALYFTVPAESEITFIDRDGEEKPLAGDAFSKIIKETMIRIVDTLYIRVPHTESIGSNIRYKCKFSDKKVTEESFHKLMADVDKQLSTTDKDEFGSLLREEKERIMDSLKEFDIINSYGIFIDEIRNMDPATFRTAKQGGNLTLHVSVPENSVYKYMGNEISGDNAAKFAIVSLTKIGIYGNDKLKFEFYTRTGECWTKDDYERTVDERKTMREKFLEILQLN